MGASPQSPVFPWRISTYPPGIHNVVPSRTAVKDQQMLEWMVLPPSRVAVGTGKSQQPHWSPALYEKGARRGNSNVRRLSALVYDFDDVSLDPRAAADLLVKTGKAWALHTTWSHQVDDPHYRVILFLQRLVKPDEHKRTWTGGLRWLKNLGLDSPDQQCKDLARTYYLPRVRAGVPYEGYLGVLTTPLEVEKLMELGTDTSTGNTGAAYRPTDPVLLPITRLTLEGGSTQTVGEIIESGAGKYKCHCPFEAGSSFGSAFLRVTTDGRALLVCSSAGHGHPGSQFWMKKEGDKRQRVPARSVKKTGELLGELPDGLVQGIERRFVYDYTKGAFFEWRRGTWNMGAAMKKDHMVDHFIGLLPEEGNSQHAKALVDRLLQLQVSGITYSSTAGPIVSQNGERLMNLYARPSMRPNPGPFPDIQKIILALCSGDKKAARWLVNWCAALIQRPERRGMVAVVVLSPLQGIGKTMFGRILAHIIGEQNSAVIGDQTLEDDFNSSYAAKLFVLADEVAVGRASRKNIIAKIKACVTDDRVPMRSMYTAPSEVENRMSWWMTSNSPRPLLIEQNDRRFTVLRPTAVSPAYLAGLPQCYKKDGTGFTDSFSAQVAGFASFLLAWKVDHELASKPLLSEAKTQIQEASQASPEAFLSVIRRLGISSVLTSWPPPIEHSRQGAGTAKGAVPTSYLYGSFVVWCQQRGLRPEPEPIFRLSMTSSPGVSLKTARVAGERIQIYSGLGGKSSAASSPSALPDNVVKL